MAQGNFTWQRGDITGDIYFDHIRPREGEPIPFLRLYLMVDGSRDAKPVKGLRIMVYGGLAELVYGHVQKGSRIGVEGHIQLRYRPNNPTPVFEIVAERVEFIRNIDFERGSCVIAEMRQRGAQGNLSEADLNSIERALQPEGGQLDEGAVE